jgi:phosphatidylethanolamine-binding protein (PEBP) family uncharacterized protein
MRLMTTAFADGQRIPAEFAFCAVDAQTHVRLSGNVNPDFAWSELPTETKSLALICTDPDVPSRGDDVNKEGRTVPATLPRVDFHHWVLVDLPPDTLPIGRGEFSRGVTARGKPGPAAPRGGRGLNDYTDWFAGNKDMAGQYFSYDGPCRHGTRVAACCVFAVHSTYRGLRCTNFKDGEAVAASGSRPCAGFRYRRVFAQLPSESRPLSQNWLRDR